MIFSNSLYGKKVNFAIQDNKVSLYVCGITPYSSPHIGHGRCYISFDILYRLLKFMGVNVTYCRNITDIDDKLLEAAQKRYGSMNQYQLLVSQYMGEFWSCLDRLNCLKPQYEPRVTDHIDAIITFIEGLIEKGFAYPVDNDVYFSVDKVAHYGELSGQKKEYLKKAFRVSLENKQNPLDFVLWKGEKETFWQSPWGNGRPGWHVECSVMASEYLGSSIDIHGGGLDLIFPHHENEKVLAEVFFDQPFVRCWMHNGLVTVNKEKMSKSLGNFIVLGDALIRFDPMVIRYFFVQHHYKSPFEWSDDLIAAGQVAYERLVNLFGNAQELVDVSQALNFSLVKAMHDALLDDLNTPMLLSIVFSNIALIAQNQDLKNAVFTYMVNVLGLNFIAISKEIQIDKTIALLLEEREIARRNRDWKKADALRDQLVSLGHAVSDAAIK